MRVVQPNTDPIFTIILDAQCTKDTTVALSSTDASVLAVPPHVIAPMWCVGVQFHGDWLSVGSTVLTAEYQGTQAHLDVQCIEPAWMYNGPTPVVQTAKMIQPDVTTEDMAPKHVSHNNMVPEGQNATGDKLLAPDVTLASRLVPKPR